MAVGDDPAVAANVGDDSVVVDYTCEHECGFAAATYEACLAHEATCAKAPPAPPKKVRKPSLKDKRRAASKSARDEATTKAPAALKGKSTPATKRGHVRAPPPPPPAVLASPFVAAPEGATVREIGRAHV